jgi:EpsI family protein
MGYFFSKGLWRRAILVILATPISVFLNSFRIWITAILTLNGHGELAENFFHDFTGWLIFMIAGVLLYLATLLLNRIGSDRGDRLEKDVGGHRSGFARPIAIAAVTCLAFVTSGWALKEIPSVRNVPARITFKSFPLTISEWQAKRSYISKEILDQLWADDYVQATFSNPDSGNAIFLLIPFYEYQGIRHAAHAPQACLLGGGWALTRSQKRPVTLDDGNQINIMTMNLKKGNAKILGSYFFLQRGRVITSPWMNKYYLFRDSITKGRTDGALVRAEMVLTPGQTMEEAWFILEKFISELWKILPHYVPA